MTGWLLLLSTCIGAGTQGCMVYEETPTIEVRLLFDDDLCISTIH